MSQLGWSIPWCIESCYRGHYRSVIPTPPPSAKCTGHVSYQVERAEVRAPRHFPSVTQNQTSIE